MGVAELLALSGKRVLDEVRRVYGEEGPFTTVALDVGRAKENAPHEIDLRWRGALEAARAQGAPSRHLALLEERVGDVTSLPGEVRRTLVACDRGLVLDVEHQAHTSRDVLVAVGALPSLLPLLAEATSWVPYLVVESGRTDASVHLRVAGRGGEWNREISGDDQYARKVHAGGWSELRWQHTAEQVWHGNQSQVADEVERLAHAAGIELLVVTGDVRVRTELAEMLRGRTRADVVQVEAHTLPAGADDTALAQELEEALDRETRARLDRVLERLRADNGSAGAVGLDGVVRALSDAQVATLLLRPTALHTESLVALREAPWLGPPTGSTSLGVAPAADVLARAALLTDGEVLVVDDDVPELDQGVAASLRWPKDARQS